MKEIQLKYTFLQIFYWLSSCALQGYTAILLLSKGLSNTEIGIVTGVSCVLSIFLSPYISSMPTKFQGLTVKKLMYACSFLSAVSFLALSFVKLPVMLIMLFYIFAILIFVAIVPFLSKIATDYIHEGYTLNFGLARGMGSVSYATSALILAQFVNYFSPDFVSVIYSVGSLLFVGLLHTIDVKESKDASSTNGNVFVIIQKYKSLFFTLCGFALCFAGGVTCATYLIHIVKNLGGDTTMYSIAVFLMAVSEMPAMSVTRRLMRRFQTMDLIIVAGVCYLIRNVLICIAPNLFVLFIGMLFQSASYGLLTSLLTYHVTDICDKEDEMMGQTLIAIMTTGIGSTLGNVVGGVLQDSFGIQAMLLFVIVLTVIGSAIMVVTGLKYRNKNVA